MPGSNPFAAIVIGLAAILATDHAAAEELGGSGQWLARSHQAGQQKLCYAISAPVESAGGPDGRGPVGALITSLDGGATRDQISVVLGYQPKTGTVIRAAIDGKNYILRRIDGDRAWAKDEAADKMIVAAMKRGNRMRVSGTTAAGDKVEDTFSLAGLSKTLRLVAGACSIP